MPKSERHEDPARRAATMRNHSEDHTGGGVTLADDESEDTRRRNARIVLIIAATRGELDLTEPMFVSAEEIHQMHQMHLRIVMDVDTERNGLLVSFVQDGGGES